MGWELEGDFSQFTAELEFEVRDKMCMPMRKGHTVLSVHPLRQLWVPEEVTLW
jgi:uncharacterized membrane protein YobD (UPF0266 family)